MKTYLLKLIDKDIAQTENILNSNKRMNERAGISPSKSVMDAIKREEERLGLIKDYRKRVESTL